MVDDIPFPYIMLLHHLPSVLPIFPKLWNYLLLLNSVLPFFGFKTACIKLAFLGTSLNLRPFLPQISFQVCKWNSQHDLLPGDVSGCWSPRHFFATSWPCWYAAAAWRCNWLYEHGDTVTTKLYSIFHNHGGRGKWRYLKGNYYYWRYTHFSLPPWLLGGKSILITSGKFCLLQLLQVVSFHRDIVIGNGKDWIFVLERIPNDPKNYPGPWNEQQVRTWKWMAWNTNTIYFLFGGICLPIFRVHFYSSLHQPSAPGNLTPPRIPRDFWLIPGHTGRAEAPSRGKKTGKTVKPSHFPAVQPSCNHHIHHSNWHNWSKNSNMFDKFAFFPSLWPTMMRYSSKSDFIPMALSCLSNLERIAQTFKWVPATVTSSVCKDTWIIQKSRIPIEVWLSWNLQ